MRVGPPVADVVASVEEAGVTDGVGRLVLQCPDEVRGARAGQFVLVRSLAPGAPLLPRPLSVLFSGDRLELLFNVVGAGTRALAALRPGDPVGLVGPLGHPFAAPDEPILIVGDGSHVGTMLGLARERGTAATVIHVATGHPADPALVALFEATGATVEATDRAGLAAALARTAPAFVAAGAADDVLATVQRWAATRGIPGEAALQAPMACGLGACHVCVRPFAAGLRLVCEGPVFPLAEARFAEAAHG
jgi:dihydroorotate dehydrogenase electron transfer subunit